MDDDALARRDRRIALLERELARIHLLLATSTDRVRSLEEQVQKTVMGIALVAPHDPKVDSATQAVRGVHACDRCRMLERQLSEIGACIAGDTPQGRTGAASHEEAGHREIEAEFLAGAGLIGAS